MHDEISNSGDERCDKPNEFHNDIIQSDIMGKSKTGHPSGIIKYGNTESQVLFKNNELEDETCSILKSWSTRTSRPHTSTQKSERASSSKSSFRNLRNIEEWVNRKSLGRIQKHHSSESHGTRKLCDAVLNNEENFVKGIDNFLEQNKLLQLRKKELLHKDWAKQVYTPSRRKIEQTIENGFPLVDEIKRREYKNYLNYSNKKGNIFLDVISRDEYDAFLMLEPESPAKLKAHIPRLHDPLLSQERNRISEMQTIIYCETGKIVSKDFIRQLWLPKYPLKPLGRQGKTCGSHITLPERHVFSPNKSQIRRNPNEETFDFGSWANPGEDYSIVRQEMKIQTRKPCPGTGSVPSSPVVEVVSPLNTEKKLTVRFALPEIHDSAQPVSG